MKMMCLMGKFKSHSLATLYANLCSLGHGYLREDHDLTDDIHTTTRPQSRMTTTSTTQPSEKSSQRQPQTRRERRPPKQPKERTQRLASANVEADGAELQSLMSSMNPMGRKNLKAEAKRKRRTEVAILAGEDVDMPSDG